MYPMIILLIFTKLLIRMTLTLPTLMISIIKITFNNAALLDNKIQETKASLFWEFLAWLFYILSYSFGFFVGPSIIILHDVILAPTYAWKLIWQPSGRSIFTMLRDPCGHNNKNQDRNRTQRILHERRSHPQQWRRGYQRFKGGPGFNS